MTDEELGTTVLSVAVTIIIFAIFLVMLFAAPPALIIYYLFTL